MPEETLKWTVYVSVAGLFVAVVAFVWNQLYAVYSRRRDFLIGLLEAANLCFSHCLGDIEPEEQNKALALAAARAELGLNGKVRQTALDFIHRLGPRDAPKGNDRVVDQQEKREQIREEFNRFIPELWKHAHPFQRLWRGRPPLPPPDEVYHSARRTKTS